MLIIAESTLIHKKFWTEIVGQLTLKKKIYRIKKNNR